MRIFVLGGTGHIGREVIDRALERGHDVTAFVRSPSKVPTRERLRVVAGDPRSTDDLRSALPGHQAVISSLGPNGREGFRPCTLMTDCAASTVAAMTETGVPRLGIVSAAVLFPETGLFFSFFRWLLRHHVHDLTTMETIVTASQLAYTIARPPRLVGRNDAAYHAADGALPGSALSATFRGVATFMIDAIETNAFVRSIVGVTR